MLIDGDRDGQIRAARLMQIDHRGALAIPSGVPVACVLRTALDSNGDTLEVLDSVLPADRYLFRYVGKHRLSERS